MPIPISQSLRVAVYVLSQKIKGRKRYPLVLMLEPLFQCNLTCVGCGKIQFPKEILEKRLTPEECFRAAEECGAPIVSLPGGEPLIHPEIDRIVTGLVARKKYVYLCTNGLLLTRKLDLFRPSKYLTINVHLDGLKEEHDRAVSREGAFEAAVEGIREALRRRFRVTTNTTVYDGIRPERLQALFDFLMDLGVEAMTISPGYSYEKAADQGHFLKRRRTEELFSQILANRKRRWNFNHSPLYLRFLQGREQFPCTPWGNPTYNIFGWQRPCYLFSEGYASSFRELMETTEWGKYGNGRDECADCMVHSGYEPSAVEETFRSLRGFFKTIRFLCKSFSTSPSETS